MRLRYRQGSSRASLPGWGPFKDKVAVSVTKGSPGVSLFKFPSNFT